MAIRKNKKRIDPRYFLNETTYRDLDEQPETRIDEAQGRLMPYLMGQGWDPGQDRPLEALKGFMLGDLDLADAVRDWSREVQEYSLHNHGRFPSGTPSSEIAAEYMKENPDRAKAFEYLKGIVGSFDQFMGAMSKQIDAGQDIGPLQAEFEKTHGREMQKAMQQLPKLFKPSKGTAARAKGAKELGSKYNTRDRQRYNRQRAQQKSTDKF
jgi:hypothetical protein|tara:strand:+ start:56 stop:685 length:630 start_codon:yes stop_codon:yes gene_type:complete